MQGGGEGAGVWMEGVKILSCSFAMGRESPAGLVWHCQGWVWGRMGRFGKDGKVWGGWEGWEAAAPGCFGWFWAGAGAQGCAAALQGPGDAAAAGIWVWRAHRDPGDGAVLQLQGWSSAWHRKTFRAGKGRAGEGSWCQLGFVCGMGGEDRTPWRGPRLAREPPVSLATSQGGGSAMGRGHWAPPGVFRGCLGLDKGWARSVDTGVGILLFPAWL